MKLLRMYLIMALCLSLSISADDDCAWYDSLNFDVHAGVAPTFWNQRDCFELANTFGVDDSTQLSVLGRLPSFHHLFRVPFDVGFRVGYDFEDCLEATFEFDYRSSKARECSTCWTCSTVTPNAGQLNFSYTTSDPADGVPNFFISNIDRYRSYAGHVGARWYTERYCCDVAFFLGIKVGFVHHKEIDVNINQVNVTNSLVTVSLAPYPFSCVPLFCRNTTISAGGLIGVDWLFCENLSLVLQVEALGQGPLQASHNLGSKNCGSCDCFDSACVNISDVQAQTTNIVGADFAVEVVVPVTFGLKYYF